MARRRHHAVLFLQASEAQGPPWPSAIVPALQTSPPLRGRENTAPIPRRRHQASEAQGPPWPSAIVTIVSALHTSPPLRGREALETRHQCQEGGTKLRRLRRLRAHPGHRLSSLLCTHRRHFVEELFGNTAPMPRRRHHTVLFLEASEAQGHRLSSLLCTHRRHFVEEKLWKHGTDGKKTAPHGPRMHRAHPGHRLSSLLCRHRRHPGDKFFKPEHVVAAFAGAARPPCQPGHVSPDEQAR